MRRRLLVAPNAFKGCLTAAEAARELARGARRADSRVTVDLMPVSDGGDGLMEVLLGRFGGRRVARRVTGPLGEPRLARYALLGDGRTAIVEMAQASGIAGIPKDRLNPMRATSFGTGELLLDALRRGVRRVIVGLGGSAANDGGAGMAAALGARLLDSRGEELSLGAAPLARLSRVDMSSFVSLHGVEVIAVSDVRNPLLGREGSARVYGPQKGATPVMVRALERALSRYARILERDLGRGVAGGPGAGAAGGLGAGLAAFLGARIVPGAAWVLDALDADRRIARADLVLTGEGRLDRQSFFGKAPVVLARRAKRLGVPMRFLCGRVDGAAAGRLRPWGREAAVSLSSSGESLEAARRRVRRRLRQAAESVVRAFFAPAVLSIVVSVPLSSSPTASGDVGAPREENALREAERRYWRRHEPGNLERSQQLLLAGLEMTPEDPQLLWRAGRGTFRAGERQEGKKARLAYFRRSEQYLRKAVALAPDSPDAHYWLGLAMGRRGQAQGILKSLFLVGPIRAEMKRTLELDPKHGGAHHVLGEMLRRIPGFAGGSKEGAVAELEKALELWPGWTANHPALAEAYLDIGDSEKAREALRRLFEVEAPDDPGEHGDNVRDAREMLERLETSRPR